MLLESHTLHAVSQSKITTLIGLIPSPADLWHTDSDSGGPRRRLHLSWERALLYEP